MESQSKSRIGLAATVLEEIKAETWVALTEVRVVSDDLEEKRRHHEQKRIFDRSEAIQAETASMEQRNRSIETEWAELLKVNIPQDLHQELLAQRVACQQFLEAKDQRVSASKQELKNKDEEYVQMLKQQSDEISKLLDGMRQQYQAVRKSYEEQLEAVESAFEQERAKMLTDGRAQIEVLFEKRRQMEETEIFEQRRGRKIGCQRQIEELRLNFQDEYNRCKLALERGIQELEQQHEKMTSTYLMNKEKLDYNLQVLAERNKEHQTLQSSSKTRLSKLRETLNTLKARCGAQDQKYKLASTELSEEYVRLTRQLKDLQEKLLHFEQADENTFREVWEMNEQEARELVEKAREADRILHEQQLGLEWVPATQEELDREVEMSLESVVITSGQPSQTELKAVRRQEDRIFWERLGHAVPNMTLRIWKALEAFLRRYHELLQRRSKAIDNNSALQKQVAELRKLLGQYMGSKVSDELVIPPAHTIKVAAGDG